jgi:hypothetical protein
VTGFAAKLLHEEGDQLVFLVTGKQNRQPVWCYALIAERKRVAFQQGLKSGQVKIGDYGRILFSGKGHVPPDDVQQIIKTHYPI